MAIVSIRAQPAARTLHICHAGSLQAAFADVEKAFTAQHSNVAIDDVSSGSVTLARRLATGAQACDIFAPADYLDIELMLKPAGLADYTTFAHGRMVLAYLSTDPRAEGVSRDNWHQKLVAPGVRIAGAHPFLDPGGYRAHMVFDLAEHEYHAPGLYNALLEHYMTPASGTLGQDFSFQLTYEHSAAAAAQRNSSYRYLQLSDRVDLSATANDAAYRAARVTIPGLGTSGSAASVTIPATRAAWGVTILKNSTNAGDAISFINLLLGPVGTAALNANGPSPIVPAVVSRTDSARVPKTIKGLAIE